MGKFHLLRMFDLGRTFKTFDIVFENNSVGGIFLNLHYYPFFVLKQK